MNCKDCQNWKENISENLRIGLCDKIMGSNKVQIILSTGWEGGFVDYIETDYDFGCILFGKKEAQDERM